MANWFTEKNIMQAFCCRLYSNASVSYKKVDYDPPDYIYQLNNRRYGIELTSLYRVKNKHRKFKPQEEEKMRSQIVEEAHRCFEKLVPKKYLNVSIYFHENISLNSKSKDELINKIAIYVKNISDIMKGGKHDLYFTKDHIPNWTTDYDKPLDNCTYIYDPFCANTIHQIKIRKTINNIWESGNDLVFWIPDVSKPTIEDIIIKKEHKIKGFNKEVNQYLTFEKLKAVHNIDKMQLLIHANEDSPSSNFNVPQSLLDTVFTTEFDAVFLYQVTYSKKIWSLKTKKPLVTT